MAFIEALQAAGASVDLLVERPPRRWFAERMKSKVVDLTATKKSIALAEVFRYFARRDYSTGWVERTGDRRFMFPFLRKILGRAYIASVKLRAGSKITVENDPDLVDFVPALAWHLTYPNRFVVAPSVYTEMVLRAAWGLPPSTIDGSGYDLVIIDTPAYFKVKGIDAKRILAVVHDIIPLRDPTMTPYWRSLFFKKLEAVLALNPNFAFVSEYSRSYFRRGFPTYKMRSSCIIYPTLRKSLVKRAAAVDDSTLMRFAPAELNNLERSMELQDRMDSRRIYDNAMEKRIAMTARYQRVARLEEAYLRLGWDTRLPYFVTVVSDETRKNIPVLMKAFAALKGRANMVVLGNVQGERYVGDNPDSFGHVRFTDYIPESEKTRIIAKSDGMIFPSFTEGFGIPITEGAAFGKVVLCSNIEVFREIAGDEAYYFDPYKDDTLVAAVDAVIASPEESRQRAARLKARVLERFTIDATTARVKALLEEVGLKVNPSQGRPASPAADKAHSSTQAAE